jgi:hypothetical protein
VENETVKGVQSQAERGGPVALEIGAIEEVGHQHAGLRGRKERNGERERERKGKRKGEGKGQGYLIFSSLFYH